MTDKPEENGSIESNEGFDGGREDEDVVRNGFTDELPSGSHNTEVNVKEEELLLLDDNDENDGSSTSNSMASYTYSNHEKRSPKKYMGEKAMLAEAQRKYPNYAAEAQRKYPIYASETKRSSRIQAKKRKRYTDGREKVIATDYDNCDCLMTDCPGCHFPCRRCGDTRCGFDCRRGRRWVYTTVEVDGRNIELTNPNSKST